MLNCGVIIGTCYFLLTNILFLNNAHFIYMHIVYEILISYQFKRVNVFAKRRIESRYFFNMYIEK